MMNFKLYVEDLSNGINYIFHGKSCRRKGIGGNLRQKTRDAWT